MNFFRKRDWKFLWQKMTRGWSDQETWSLDHEIAKFVLPRIQRFKELKNGYPCNMSPEEWDTILSKIEFSMEQIAKEDPFEYDEDMGKIENKANRIQEGCKLFGKYFQNLWW